MQHILGNITPSITKSMLSCKTEIVNMLVKLQKHDLLPWAFDVGNHEVKWEEGTSY